MLKSILKGGSIAFLLFGLYNMVTGNPAGFVYLVAGSIMDLQARNLDLEDRMKVLEENKKEKKDATESTQGS